MLSLDGSSQYGLVLGEFGSTLGTVPSHASEGIISEVFSKDLPLGLFADLLRTLSVLFVRRNFVGSKREMSPNRPHHFVGGGIVLRA